MISALTVPTAEGNLFNVDMRLRPSGQKGPVATSIKSFEAYQKNDAWVWETLALSRGRVIAGNAELRKKLKIIIQEILKKESIHKQVVKQVEKMRTSLSLKNSNSKNFLGVKDGPGNLMDLELLIQMGCLLTKRFDYQSPYKMLKILKQVGFFTVDEFNICRSAYELYFSMQQISSIVGNEDTLKEHCEIGSKVSASSCYKSSNILKTKLKSFSKSIRSIFEKKIETYCFDK